MIPSIVCPATCELCGNWLPQHQDSCPRNGVHPSQWNYSSILEHEHKHEEYEQKNGSDIDFKLSYPKDLNYDNCI